MHFNPVKVYELGTHIHILMLNATVAHCSLVPGLVDFPLYAYRTRAREFKMINDLGVLSVNID